MKHATELCEPTVPKTPFPPDTILMQFRIGDYNNSGTESYMLEDSQQLQQRVKMYQASPEVGIHRPFTQNMIKPITIKAKW